MPLPLPSFLPHHGPHADSFFPSSEEEHTDQWISVSRAPQLQPRNLNGDADTSTEDFFASAIRSSSPVRHRLDFEIEPEAESASWARNVESRLAGLSPTTPGRRSRSVDELGMYPRRSSRQAPKPKETDKEKEKETRSNSIARRASAPLLGSSGSKKRLKPIDTTSYVRKGITPPGTAKPGVPAGQLSTFGTVYVPSWEQSRTDAHQVPRPSTAPLPSFDFGINVKPEPETDEEVGGVHYSTYGSRVSDIYEDSPFSDTPPAGMPFADASVPIPASLLGPEKDREKGHKKTGSMAALLRKVGNSGPATPLESRSRKMTVSSIGTVTPDGDSGARPTTPAIPDFLAASRTDDTPPDSPKLKLRTRASLLSLAALASRHGSSEEVSMSAGHSSSTPVASPQAQAQAQPRPRESASPPNPRPRSALMRLAARFTSQGSEEQDDTGAQADESYVTVDDTFTSMDQMLGEGGVLSEPETETEGREFGVLSSPPTSPRSRTWSKLSSTFGGRTRKESSAGRSRKESSSGRARKESSAGLSRKESLTGRGRFDSLGARSRLDSLNSRGRLDSLTGRNDATLTRRRSADVLSAEGATEGTVMYGVGEEMLRLMYGGGAVPVSSPGPVQAMSSQVQMGSVQGKSSGLGLVQKRSMGTLEPILDNSPSKSAGGTSQDNSSPTPVQTTFSSQLLTHSPQLLTNSPQLPIDSPSKHVLQSKRQAPEPRERTRSLPRRVSPPRGDLATLFTPPLEHEVDIGLFPDFGGSLDLRFSNPASALTPPTGSALTPPTGTAAPPRRPKGHRRGASSKENARTRPKNRGRSKSAPLGVSAELQKSLTAGPIKPGILMNGNTNANANTSTPAPGRVVIVNSATTTPPSPSPAPRQTTRSNPMPMSTESGGGGDSADTSLSVPGATHPGVVVTAPTPPAPRRSLSMPLDGALSRSSGAPLSAVTETTRGSVSRGTSVQFAPESLEASRRSRRAAASSSADGESGNGNGKGKRKVEREGTDVPDPGRSSPSKKPRLGGEEVDITFMGEPLFGGVAQVKRGRGSVDRASSHYSGRSYHHPTPGYPYPNSYAKSPSPNHTLSETPDPERASIPMRAILTPRVQSLYGAPPASDYVLRRQSLGDIQRPKSRASARDIPRPKSQASARSYATGGAKSNMTSARSHVTGARSNVTGARSNVSRATTQIKLKDRLPLQGWCFVFGFLVPFVWWYAAFARAERGYYGGGVWSRDAEAHWEGVKTKKNDYRDDGRVDAHTWRFRCRLMAVSSLVIYVPVIVLAAVFAR